MKKSKKTNLVDIKNLDKYMEFFSKQLFVLSEIQFWILYKIAEEGPLYKNRLKNEIGLTKRKVDYNTQILLENGYLLPKKSRSAHRGVKNAFGKGIKIIPTLYHLTFKGLVASLAIPLRQNYLIINYLKIILEYTDKRFSQLFLHHMYYNITLFLLSNYMKKTKLSEIGENLDWAIYDMYDWQKSYSSFFSHNELSFLTSKHQELHQKLVEKFHISSALLGNLLKHFNDFKNNEDDHNDMSGYDLTDYLIRCWSTLLLTLYTKNYHQAIKKGLENMEYRERDRSEYHNIDVKSEKIYKKLQPKGKFDIYESLIQG